MAAHIKHKKIGTHASSTRKCMHVSDSWNSTIHIWKQWIQITAIHVTIAAHYSTEQWGRGISLNKHILFFQLMQFHVVIIGQVEITKMFINGLLSILRAGHWSKQEERASDGLYDKKELAVICDYQSCWGDYK